jgi:hypothetical protein
MFVPVVAIFANAYDILNEITTRLSITLPVAFITSVLVLHEFMGTVSLSLCEGYRQEYGQEGKEFFQGISIPA